jgi:hypothetical protein
MLQYYGMPTLSLFFLLQKAASLAYIYVRLSSLCVRKQSTLPTILPTVPLTQGSTENTDGQTSSWSSKTDFKPKVHFSRPQSVSITGPACSCLNITVHSETGSCNNRLDFRVSTSFHLHSYLMLRVVNICHVQIALHNPILNRLITIFWLHHQNIMNIQ